ncbi:hypothetical protein UCDDS831_g07755 [Diplodia seriata]|uniref:Uncharacterized protein n=1 Tax=Diplodia seriata TaxID=420778 RepID=A0A0G2DX65_9PEZI|nr:hypothetical protein UCDDS831_g07755 [Diplodia seriata]
MPASPPNSDGGIPVHEDGTKPPNNSSDSLFNDNSDGHPAAAAAVSKEDASKENSSKEDVVAATPAINNNNSGDNNNNNPASNKGGSYDPFDTEFASTRQSLHAAGIPDAQLIGMAAQMMQRLGPGVQQLFAQGYEGAKTRLSALQAENEALKRRVEELEEKDDERKRELEGLVAENKRAAVRDKLADVRELQAKLQLQMKDEALLALRKRVRAGGRVAA